MNDDVITFEITYDGIHYVMSDEVTKNQITYEVIKFAITKHNQICNKLGQGCTKLNLV